DGTVYLATAAGLVIGAEGAAPAVATGLPSDDVRAIAIDHTGTIWLATAAGAARSVLGGWQRFDTSTGLASNDAHAIAIDPDGSVWIGGAAGASRIDPSGPAGSVAAVDFGGGAAPPAVRAIHTGWSSPRELAASGAANREPALAIDAAGRTWLA